MEKGKQNKKNLKNSPWILGVLSGKGGVGKSTLAALLALSFKELGLKVGVLDGDLYGPSMRALLPEDSLPDTQGEKVIPAQAQGISVISAAYFPEERAPIGVRAPIANQIITQFIDEVEWGPLDLLLVDFPPGTGDIQLTLMQKLPLNGALVITTPQELSLLDVKKGVKMAQQMGVPLFGIVENMSYYLDAAGEKHYLFGRKGGEELAREFSLPLLAQVPIDSRISECHLKNLAEMLLGILKEEKGCKIIGEDPYHFSIEWWDGKKSLYRFDAVQAHCPCIECKDKKRVIQEEITGLELIKIGNYAIQFRFSKGCSKGIYPFSLLRSFDR